MSTAPADLVDRVRTRLVSSGGQAGVDDLAAAVRAEARGVVGDADVLSAVRGLQRELVGAGPLEPLLREPGTSDVLVTAPDAVWVDRGAGLERTTIRFPDEDAVRRLAQRLASAAGRRLDDASPYVDARLPGSGVRLHAVLAPVAADGTCVSLRVLRPARHDLAALAASGTVDADGVALLRAVVAARLAFLVVGGTGLGQDDAARRAARARSRRASASCASRTPRSCARRTRTSCAWSPGRPNVEGAGQVLLRDLVRQALRMRPDRLVVGEVRGAEVVELLAALNTGHDGGAGTVHANAPREVPARLEALAALGGLGPAALHSQLAAAVQVVLQVRRDRDGTRTLDAVGVLRRRDGAGEVVVVPAWTRGDGWATGRADLGAMFAGAGRRRPVGRPARPAGPAVRHGAARGGRVAAGVSLLHRESA